MPFCVDHVDHPALGTPLVMPVTVLEKKKAQGTFAA